jgi:hypothetical protein
MSYPVVVNPSGHSMKVKEDVQDEKIFILHVHVRK